MCSLFITTSLLMISILSNAQTKMDTSIANQNFQLGVKHQNYGQLSASIDALTLAAEIYQNHELWSLFFNCKNQIARSYWRGHQLDSALLVCKEILEAKQLQKNSIQEADAFSNLGVVYDIQSDYEMALKYFHKCLNIRKEKLGENHLETGKVYYNIGVCYNYQSNSNTALEYFEKTVRNFKKNLGTNHPLLSRVYSGMCEPYKSTKQYDKGIQVASEGLKIAQEVYPANHPTIQELTYNLGVLYFFSGNKNYLEKGVQLVKKAYNIKAKSLGVDHPSMVLISQAFGNMFVGKGAHALGRPYIEKSLEIALKHYGTKHRHSARLYANLSAVYYNLGDADKYKSTLLKMALTNNDALQLGGVPDSLRQQETMLKKEIAAIKQLIVKAIKAKEDPSELQEKLFQLNRHHQALNEKLERDHYQYYQLKYKEKQISIVDIQEKLLDKNSLLIEYLITKNKLYTFIISKQDIDIQTQPLDDNFYTQVQKFRASVSNLKLAKNAPSKTHRDYTQSAYYLYQKLLEPHLKNHIKELILVTDKVLGRLPFEAMLTEKAKEQLFSYGSLKYAILRYNIRYAYSASLLLEAQQKQKDFPNNSNQILAFAASYNPSTTTTDPLRNQLVNLPGAQKEVENLKNQFQGKFHFGQEANEATFNNAEFDQFSVVHLAMHGMMDKKNPMNSAMVFTLDSSQQSMEDDWVYAYELTNMKIPTNLVVLSACETGDGKHQEVEGIMSIGRSFMYAGVPSLVMTLWQVNDFSTAFVMNEFYNELATGKPKSAALRNAKLSYIEQAKGKDLLKHPYFWAAFINLGDDSNISVLPVSNFSKWWYALIGLLFLGLILSRRIFSPQ